MKLQPVPVVSNKHILLGTVGYHLLSNHSIGPILIESIRELEWAKSIKVEELNWGPVAIVQQFQAMQHPYDRVVLLTAIERPGREIGDVNVFRWDGKLPSDKEVQARIGDAVTGVISAENLLVIGEYFQIWPPEVFIIDVEPGPEQAGPRLSPALQTRVEEYFALLKNVCMLGEAPGSKIEVLSGEQIQIC